MPMIFRALFFIVFIISQVFAGEITYTYLVYVSSFPDVPAKVDIPKGATIDGYTNLKKQGYSNNSIPLKVTRALEYPNTNYLLIKVTPKNTAEKTLFDNVVNSGGIKLLSTSEYVSEYNGRTGGMERKIERASYGKLPDDINRNWATYVSSP